MLSNSPSPPLKKGRVIYILLFFSFILILHPPSSQSSDLFKYHQVAMGTVIEITLIGDDEEAINKAALQAFQEIKRIETLMSPWLDSSDVTRINRSAGKEWVNPVRNSSGALNPVRDLSLNGINPAGIILRSDPAAAAGPEGLWPGGSSGALFLTG